MDNSPFYPCTAEDPYGFGPSSGLPGPGQLPDPSLSPFRRDVGVTRTPLCERSAVRLAGYRRQLNDKHDNLPA